MTSRVSITPDAPIPWEHSAYAMIMNFTFRIVIDGEPHVFTQRDDNYRPVSDLIMYHPMNELFDTSYTELIFVHNEGEAEGFPDSTVVAWPGDEDVMKGIMNGLHLGVLRGGLDLEDFGLSDPITIEDFVDNWEAVDRLWIKVPVRDLSTTARQYGADAFLLDIEAFHIVYGDEEVLNQVLGEGRRELGLTREDSLRLLVTVGSAEEFFAIADRLGGERFSLERILEEIEE